MPQPCSTSCSVAFGLAPWAVALGCSLISPARAAADSRPALLEVHAGPRPSDAERVIGLLLREIRAGVRHGEPLRRAIERRMSRSAGPLRIGGALRQAVEEGRREFIEGNYDRAIELLERVRRKLLASTATVASSQGFRNALHETLLFLGHAYLRAGKPEAATERVGEAIRGFPDRDLSAVRHSPELVRYFKQVRRELDRLQRGTLTVATRPKGCMVFLDGRFVGVGPTKVVDLYPGRYRVYLQRGNQRGRVHPVMVSGDDARLEVDFELDRHLDTDGFVGLQYGDRAELDRHQARHAAAIGRAIRAPQVVLVGFNRHQGRRTLVGTVVSTMMARVVRSAMLVLQPTPPSRATFKALGQFLLAGRSSPGIIVRDDDGAGEQVARRRAGKTIGAGLLKWVALAVGAGALTGGIALVAVDGEGTCDTPAGVDCPDVYQTKAAGIGLTVGAGLALAASLILFVSDTERADDAETFVAAPWLGREAFGVGAILRY